MEVETGGRIVQAVAQPDAQALSLVDAQYERLNGVALESEGDRRVGVAGAGGAVLRLLPPDVVQPLLEDVHQAVGVVVQEAVQGDLNVDGRYPEFPDGGVGATTHAARHGLRVSAAEQRPLGAVVAGRSAGLALQPLLQDIAG